MKKLLSVLLSIFLCFNIISMPAFAETEFKIYESSVKNGDTEASISALITFEFTSEIDETTLESVIIETATIKDINSKGNKLSIRLSSTLKYSREYTVNLSGLKSAGGASLPESDRLIKFKTKAGTKTTIIEDDFELGKLDTTLWRQYNLKNNKVEISPIDSDAGNGNYSYKVVDANFDTYRYGETGQYPLRFGNRAIIDFKFFPHKFTADHSFLTFAMLYNDESKELTTAGDGMLKYDYKNNKLGVHAVYDAASTHSQKLTFESSATNPAAVKLRDNAWNDVRIFVDMKAYTFRVIVNGTTLANSKGTIDFNIPSKSLWTSSATDFTICDVSMGNPASKGAFYFDNVCYMEYNAPKLVNSPIQDNTVLNSTCLELDFDFDSKVEALSFELNDVPVSSDAIIKKSDRSYYLYLDLNWDTSYTLTGTVSALYNTKREFNLLFSTSPQPEMQIEVAGFFNDNGDRLSALSSGEVSAKLKLWQPQESISYTLVLGVYKKTGDVIEMISLKSADYTLSDSSEKTISITVPSDTQNLFVKIFVLDNSTSRTPYSKTLFNGNRILQ